MATVYIVTCNVPPNTGSNNFGQQCPTADRRVIQVDPVKLEAAELEVVAAVQDVDPERIQDMQTMFYGFLLALALLWGTKQLINLFSQDTER